MKKILLAMVAFAFCIASAQAENLQSSNGTAAYTNQSVANMLAQLETASHSLQDISLGMLIAADGNKRDTRAATLLVASNTKENQSGGSSSGDNEENRKGDVAADRSAGGDKRDKTGKAHSEPSSIGSGSSASPS